MTKRKADIKAEENEIVSKRKTEMDVENKPGSSKSITMETNNASDNQKQPGTSGIISKIPAPLEFKNKSLESQEDRYSQNYWRNVNVNSVEVKKIEERGQLRIQDLRVGK